VDTVRFLGEIAALTADELSEMAAAIAKEAASAAGEIAWWEATIDVARALHEQHLSLVAAAAGHRAALVAEAAWVGAGMASGDPRMTLVASAVDEAARGLVAGRPAQAVHLLHRHVLLAA